MHVSVCVAAFSASGNAAAADFFNGESIYKKNCESCHGARGQGVIGGAPNFARGQSLMKSDALLYETIVNGKFAMPAFRGVLTEDEFFDVISYIRSFL
jgi:mono/diheme cytochrome c family protein